MRIDESIDNGKGSTRVSSNINVNSGIIYPIIVLIVVLAFLLGRPSVAVGSSSPESPIIQKTKNLGEINDVQKEIESLRSQINNFGSTVKTSTENTELATCKSNYDTLKTQKIELENTCEKDRSTLDAKFSSSEIKFTELNRTLSGLSTDYEFLKVQKTKLQTDVTVLETQSTDLNKKLGNVTSDYETLKKSYSAIMNSSGNNICCKAKVDNSRIRFFRVESDKIVCAEDLGTEIKC